MFHVYLAARTLFYFTKEKIQSNHKHFLTDAPDFPRIRGIQFFFLCTLKLNIPVNKLNKLHFKYTLLTYLLLIYDQLTKKCLISCESISSNNNWNPFNVNQICCLVFK